MINILFCVMNLNKKALGPLYDGTLCAIIVRDSRTSIPYADVRRDFARRTDCKHCQCLLRRAVISLGPRILLPPSPNSFRHLLAFVLVSVFPSPASLVLSQGIGRDYHCPRARVANPVAARRRSARVFTGGSLFSWRNARCVRVEDRCAFECAR